MEIFRPSTKPVPFAQRDAINRGILNLIRAGKRPEPAKVFAGYTGKGGLHGLRYEDFSSRHEYSEAKRKIEQGQFFTPDWIARLIAAYLNAPAGATVADLTCGAGVFANHFRAQHFFGLEIDRDAATVASYLYGAAEIVPGDLRAWQERRKFDFVVGNPPFALRWSVPDCPMANDAGEASSEDVFLWKAKAALSAGGTLCFIAPTSWLADDIVCAKALRFVSDHFVREVEILLPANSFACVGVDAFSTKIVLLRAKLAGEGTVARAPLTIDGSQLDEAGLLEAWRNGTPEYAHFRNSLGALRASLAFADQREGRLYAAAKQTLLYRFLRLNAELARQDRSGSEAMLLQWEGANKPAAYDKDGNRLPQITPEQVIRNTRAALRSIDVPDRDLVRVIRTKRGITVKTYSRTAALSISGARFAVTNVDLASGQTGAAELNAAIEAVSAAVDERNERRLEKNRHADLVRFESLNLASLQRRMRRRFDLWSRPLANDFAGLDEKRGEIRSFYAAQAARGIVVRDVQVDHLARLTAKPSGYAAWEMGCGKSLAALAWDHAKRTEAAARSAQSAFGYTLLVSSSLALELHWEGYLSHFGCSWTRPSTAADLFALATSAPVHGSRFILASHHQVSRYARVIRELAKCSVIARLIVDESDEFGTRSSLRTRSLLVAGRKIENKLLLTGTPVRNNASELFPQLELLLHGEHFFRCVAKTQTVYDSRIHDFIEVPNKEHGTSYAGHGGFALFRKCHSPTKPTVMGATRSMAALPNREELETFLNCFRSRVRLSHLVERVPFVRETLAVTLGDDEMSKYKEFEKQVAELARKHLGSSRSDRRATMLSLAHAIRLLQQIASMPAKSGFMGQGAKATQLIEAVRNSTASHLAIGVIWRESITNLLPILQREFPDREIVAFDGESTFAARRSALQRLESAPRGILITTQQSLRSSLNLPIVSEVIAESMPWNFTSLNQWAMRFCRLTSTSTVTVRLLIADNTIEGRILGLLLKKEAVARPLAGDDIDDEFGLFEEYGISAGELDELARYLAGEDTSLRHATAA